VGSGPLKLERAHVVRNGRWEYADGTCPVNEHAMKGFLELIETH